MNKFLIFLSGEWVWIQIGQEPNPPFSSPLTEQTATETAWRGGRAFCHQAWSCLSQRTHNSQPPPLSPPPQPSRGGHDDDTEELLNEQGRQRETDTEKKRSTWRGEVQRVRERKSHGKQRSAQKWEETLNKWIFIASPDEQRWTPSIVLRWHTKHDKRGQWKHPELELTVSYRLSPTFGQEQRQCSTVSVKALGTMRQGRWRDCNTGALTHVLPVHAHRHAGAACCGWMATDSRGGLDGSNIQMRNSHSEQNKRIWVIKPKLCASVNQRRPIGQAACVKYKWPHAGITDSRKRRPLRF